MYTSPNKQATQYIDGSKINMTSSAINLKTINLMNSVATTDESAVSLNTPLSVYWHNTIRPIPK